MVAMLLPLLFPNLKPNRNCPKPFKYHYKCYGMFGKSWTSSMPKFALRNLVDKDQRDYLLSSSLD